MRPLPQGSAGAFLQEPPVSWASWTRITSSVLDAADTASNISIQRLMVDELNKFVYYSDATSNLVSFVGIDGTGYTQTSLQDNGSGFLGKSLATKSNLYCVLNGQGPNRSKVYVMGNGSSSLLQTIDETANFSTLGAVVITISPSGKYIVIVGGDATNPKRTRLVVYQGNLSS